MDWARFPSLNSLRAFATVAETGSYSRAGIRLNVSHAAVSQQVKALEARLGVTLVVREGRGIKLTNEGAALARDLTRGLAAIREGVETLTGADTTRPVQVTMSPAFAVSWLMPRIMDFQHQHRGITLMLNPTAEVIELVPGGIDMAIRFGDGDWPGMEVTPLLLPEMVVVAARKLIGRRVITDPAMLVEMPWLQELGTDEVTEWMERQGVAPQRPLMITHMPGNLILEAVRRGDGLTYTARCFVDKEIESRQLAVLSSESDMGGYYIVTRPGELRPPVRAFVKWLKHQAATEN
ncbi:MAG: LysR family transcriptional regulator [Rhodospirillales bacterium]|nr:LysR family transcriptional regulator [Rhodospirillales bacterium]